MLEIAQLFICKKLKQQHQFKPRKMLNTYISTDVNFIKNLFKVSLSSQWTFTAVFQWKKHHFVLLQGLLVMFSIFNTVPLISELFLVFVWFTI